MDLEHRTQWEADARAWFETTIGDTAGRAESSDLAVYSDLSDDDERAMHRGAQNYRRARFDAGYGALTLPEEHGGAGLPPSYAAIFNQLEEEFSSPASTELTTITANMVAPAIAMFGTQTQREKFLQPLLRTDLLCCQLFSEPGAGSDLAALACRATRDGDRWIVNGQKVWTSGARFADFGFLLARTDPDVPKHAGITAFLLPLDATGVTIRPIRQMSGGSNFNEVFLDDVEISDELRIGEPGQGWAVTTTILGLERKSGETRTQTGGSFADLLALARSEGATGDPAILQKLAQLYVLGELKSATAVRVAKAAAAGVDPGPAGSVGKLVNSELIVSIGELAADILGTKIVADLGDHGFDWTAHLLGAPAVRIAGGADQIQRNIIAERVLGLPSEPRLDKGVPFSQLQRG